MLGKKKNKKLKQTTLFDHPKSSPRRTSSAPHKLSQPLSTRCVPLPDSGESSEGGLDTIKLEPKATHVSDSDSNENVSPSKRRRIVNGKRHIVISDEEDQPIHKRRRLAKRRAVESSESEDIAEEVEKEHILSSRLRTRDRKTAFQKNLERLKRKKQGKPMDLSSEPDQEKTEDDNSNIPFRGSRPTVVSDSDNDSLFDGSDSSNSSDFIVEDDGAIVPPLPMRFSMETHQDLDHQFKKIFQFFVHIAVRPGPARREFMKDQMRNEEYFSVPMQVVRRKLSGIRDSLVASSVWKPGFRQPLDTYPEFDLLRLEFSISSCDACNLGGRVSTLMGRLSGLPYDRWGFEVDDEYLGAGDSESDSGASGDEGKRSKTPPATVEFYLGRFCGRRTRVYHEFSHWEWSLFKCIRDELDDLRTNMSTFGREFYKVAYAGAKRPPKDLTDADGLCDWLDSRKVIDIQWEKMKAMMESARHLELAAKNAADED